MSCDEVLKQLSEFFDGVLDSKESIGISRHIEQCENCRKELESLSALHDRLASVEKVQAPDYLYHLVKIHLKNYENRAWYHRVKDSAALRWSRFRTTGFQFYWTRALGIVVAAFFFCMIFSGIALFHATGDAPSNPGDWTTHELRKQFLSTTSKSLGGIQIEQNMDKYWNRPAISVLVLDRIMESVPETMDEENLSVVLAVGASGTMTIENVLEQPENTIFLQVLNNVITSATARPGSKAGKSVPSLMFLIFNRVTVFASAD